MRKFVFQLESVLEYRQNMEDHEKNLLGRAVQKALAEEQSLDKLSLKRQQHLTACKSSEVNLTFIHQQEVHLQYIEAKINQSQEKLIEAKKKVKIHKRSLVDASKKRKMIEKIREKRLQEYRRDLAKEEQGILDEAGIAAYCRNNKG
jgi:flagellar FliJ protein